MQSLGNRRVHHEIQRLERLPHQSLTVNRFQICHEDHSLLVLAKDTYLWQYDANIEIGPCAVIVTHLSPAVKIRFNFVFGIIGRRG